METAYVLVKSKIGHEMEVMNDILKIDGIKEVMGIYGVYDIFVKVQVSTRKDIEQVIQKTAFLTHHKCSHASFRREASADFDSILRAPNKTRMSFP